MFYHYNTIANEEVSTLTESYKDNNDNQCCHSSIIDSGVSGRRKLNNVFSEKFEFIKENDKTICEIVFPRKSTMRLLILILLFVGFLYFGAWIFKILEHSNEVYNRDMFKGIRKQFLKEHVCISDLLLEKFIKSVEDLKDMGLSARNNASEDIWNIPTAVFFATTLVTTIGYGNDKPLTVWGKIFCILFVIIGLPLMMILATAVIERLIVLIDLSFSAICYKYKWRITEDKFRQIQIIVCATILIVGFVFVPAWAFVAMEEGRWTYLESVYYCIISLTTIGLGDYVPGDSPNKTQRDLTKILSTVYLFTGLLWASFCIQTFHRYQRWNIGANLFYLESDITDFKYHNLPRTSSNSVENCSNHVREYTNLDSHDQEDTKDAKKTRFQSYS